VNTKLTNSGKLTNLFESTSNYNLNEDALYWAILSNLIGVELFLNVADT
jgi:hypothetical protein